MGVRSTSYSLIWGGENGMWGKLRRYRRGRIEISYGRLSWLYKIGVGNGVVSGLKASISIRYRASMGPLSYLRSIV